MASSRPRAKVNDPVNCPTGTAACRGEQVTYSLSGTTLMRQEIGVDASPLPIATGISALTFTYLKDDNTAAATREDIRSVQIVINVTTATGTPDDNHHDGSDSPAVPLSGSRGGQAPNEELADSFSATSVARRWPSR